MMAIAETKELKHLNILQTAELLGVSRFTIADFCRCLKIQYKSFPSRYGNWIESADIDRIASALNLVVDWTTEKVSPKES